MTPEHSTPGLPDVLTLRHQALRDASTTDLVSELLTRYEEALFVGCKPHGTMTHNGHQPGGKATPVVDVNSKLDKSTGMGGTLATILARVLNSLRAKGQAAPSACAN